MKANGFLGLNRYSILSRYYSELSDDSLGDTPVPMPNTEVKPLNAGSSWGLPPVRYGSRLALGSLAQLGEHLPYKQRVSGSIPLTPILAGVV